MPIPDNLDGRHIERRFQALEAQIPSYVIPSDAGALPTPISDKVFVASGVMTTGQQSIAHGLAYTPKIYGIVMTTAGSVFQSAVPDATNVYVTPDATSRQCIFTLGR